MNIQGFLNNKELFSVRSISKGLEIIRFRAGLMGRLGWFQEQGIPGSLSVIERRFTNIQLLTPHRRGGAAQSFDIERRAGIPVEVPQYDSVANVSNADILNLRKFDGGYSLEDLQTLIMRTSKQQIEVALEPTLEYMRISCLGGKTCNGDGTVAIDWDTLLGRPRPASTVEKENFDEATVNGWIDIIQDAAGGMPYEETVALCGTNFWANLLTNPKFRESRNHWQMGQGQRTEYWDQVGEITQIVWNGVRFIKYPAYTFGVKEAGKTPLTFPADKAYVFPIGIPGKFMTQFALGDFNELSPDDVGLKYYAKLEPNDFGRGMKIYLQSNALIYDAFPETTIEVSLEP
ncbi:MAG: major capsid protein [Planctomycetaceae bacterium]|jgi:hypothetical protein|nr:major capsid protein [Planctomycetaceae bacterium]